MRKKGDKGGRKSLRKRSERRLKKLKLLSLCPQKRHEQREQREQRFKIKHLQRERGKIKSEHHEQTFKINDLAMNEVDEVNAVGAVEPNNPTKRSSSNFV